MVLCIYVDDLLFTRNSKGMFAYFKHNMFQEFEMTDMGLKSYFMGIQVHQGGDGIFISQKKYMKEIHNKFKMTSCSIVNTLVLTNHMLSKEGEDDDICNTLLS